MIFSELYSAYYNTVAEIISRLLEGKASEKELAAIVSEKAFGESALTILPALKSGRWQLLRRDMTPVIEHTPTMPLTLLQKRWLKAVSLDPRIKLFGAEFPPLEGIEPLFYPDDYRVYDKYADGDDYEDEAYIGRFRFLLAAIREKTPVKINVTNKNGKNVYAQCIPVRLEYSEKDDKFRLITSGCRFLPVVNLAKIKSCAKYNGERQIRASYVVPRYETITLEITNERNALERVMLHFAHFEKRAERLDSKHYSVTVKYEHGDETEMLVRVLSFGPMVKVVAPERFRELIKERLLRQMACGLE
ncbi:MAG: WYL domain-containing protein [Clostridia bacterium]|nr:WYL domain-containing protein [Clostridia bacterium]